MTSVFTAAIETKDVVMCRNLLNNGASPSDYDMETVIECAADTDDPAEHDALREILELLLDHSTADHALFALARYAPTDSPWVMPFYNAILARNPDVNYASKNVSSFMAAALNDQPFLSNMIALPQLNIAAADPTGANALHYAARSKQVNRVEGPKNALYKLVNDARMDINTQNIQGETAIVVAIGWSLKNNIRALVALGANLDICDDGDSTPFMLTEEDAELFPGKQAGPTQGMLIDAMGDLEHFQTIFEDITFDINTVFYRRKLVLTHALDFPVVLEFLLSHPHVDVNARGYGGTTTLHEAVLTPDYTDLIPKLLEHGADVNAQDISGNTSLIMAASAGSDGEDTSNNILLLLDAHADTSLRDNRGKTFYDFILKTDTEAFQDVLRRVADDLAAHAGAPVSAPIRYSVKRAIEENSGKRLREFLEMEFVNPNATFGVANRPLLVCAMEAYADLVVRILIQFGANTAAPGVSGMMTKISNTAEPDPSSEFRLSGEAPVTTPMRELLYKSIQDTFAAAAGGTLKMLAQPPPAATQPPAGLQTTLTDKQFKDILKELNKPAGKDANTLLTEMNVDINARASSNKHTLLVGAIVQQSPTAVEKLLAAGADIHLMVDDDSPVDIAQRVAEFYTEEESAQTVYTMMEAAAHAPVAAPAAPAPPAPPAPPAETQKIITEEQANALLNELEKEDVADAKTVLTQMNIDVEATTASFGGKTLLGIAVRKTKVQSVKKLLAAGASIAKKSEGLTLKAMAEALKASKKGSALEGAAQEIYDLISTAAAYVQPTKAPVRVNVIAEPYLENAEEFPGFKVRGFQSPDGNIVPVYVTTLRRGTLLFRAIPEDAAVTIQQDTLGIYKPDKDEYCLPPHYNVFFYPFPFVDQTVGSYGCVCVYALVQDIKIACYISPAPLARADRTIQQMPLVTCQSLKPEQHGCELAGRGYDPCFDHTFLSDNPDITGMIAIAGVDRAAFVAQLKHGNSISRNMNRYISAYLDSHSLLPGVPEIILYPRAWRYLTSVNTKLTPAMTYRQWAMGNKDYISYTLVHLITPRTDEGIEAFMEKFTGKEGWKPEEHSDPLHAVVDKETGFFVIQEYAEDDAPMLEPGEAGRLSELFDEFRFVHAPYFPKPISSLRRAGGRRSTLRTRKQSRKQRR